MKNFIKFFMIIVLCFTLVACNSNNSNENGNEKPPIENGGNEEKDPDEGDNDKDPNEGNNEDNDPNENNPTKPNELYITIPENKELKVVQFADIHFGIEGKDWHNDKVDRTKLYMDYVIETEKPDLIVCSGDNILSTGTSGLNSFIKYMDKYETPWVFVYGNHDAESSQLNYKKSDLSNYLSNSDSEYLLYKEGYVEEGKENRYGNFSINIYNSSKTKLLGAFIILDSGEHDYSIGEYQYITEGQIDWYKSEIDRLQDLYNANPGDNQYEIIPTIVFTHIQLPEFKTAYVKALNNDGATFIIEQQLSESDIDGIGTGGPSVNSGFYDVLVEKGSTKAYFVGHQHTLYFQVEMDGIILGFGPQTGFSKLFTGNDKPRKTHCYYFKEDLTFETKCIDEIVRNKGLAYNATNGSGNALYNSETGEYTFTVQLGLWGRVSLDYYGDELTTEYTRITYNNTSVTGAIKETIINTMFFGLTKSNLLSFLDSL